MYVRMCDMRLSCIIPVAFQASSLHELEIEIFLLYCYDYLTSCIREKYTWTQKLNCHIFRRIFVAHFPSSKFRVFIANFLREICYRFLTSKLWMYHVASWIFRQQRSRSCGEPFRYRQVLFRVSAICASLIIWFRTKYIVQLIRQ